MLRSYDLLWRYSETRFVFNTDMTRADSKVIPLAKTLDIHHPYLGRSWLGTLCRGSLSDDELSLCNTATWHELLNMPSLGSRFHAAAEVTPPGEPVDIIAGFGRTCLYVLHEIGSIDDIKEFSPEPMLLDRELLGGLYFRTSYGSAEDGAT